LVFHPTLTKKHNAAERLEAGQVFKIIFRFRPAFWDEEDFVKHRIKQGLAAGKLNFVHSQDEASILLTTRFFGGGIVLIKGSASPQHLNWKIAGTFDWISDSEGEPYAANDFMRLRSGATIAQPEVLERVCVCRLVPLPITLAKTKQVPFPKVKTDLAVWIRAFRKHEPSSLEKNYILTALDASGGVGTRAAELLKMSYCSFRHYSKKYAIR
jgi:hypothetical protein